MKTCNQNMAQTFTCPICAEDVFRGQIIACPKCDMQVCQTCVVQRIKTTNGGDGSYKCMNPNCDHTCDRTFIIRNLPPSIVFTTLKKHREEVLFEREKALLPATMTLIPVMTKEKELKAERDEIYAQISILKARLKDIDLNIMECVVQRQQITNGINPRTTSSATSKPSPVKMEIICPCSAKECRGFVMKANKKCGLCNSEICGKCHVILTADHKCNSDDIASVELIKKECKACPGCGVPSRKTEGCAQVWCYVCHKAWNWNTRQIENGPIHAWDYLNHMRTNNQAVPVACGTHLNPAHHLPRLQSKYPKTCTNEVVDEVLLLFQVVAEYIYEMNTQIRAPDNTDLRISYLKKEIDEKQWKQLLHKRDKAYTFKIEIHRMRVAYTQIMRDAITNLCNSQNEKQFEENLSALRDFHNIMVVEYGQLAKAFTSKRQCPWEF